MSLIHRRAAGLSTVVHTTLCALVAFAAVACGTQSNDETGRDSTSATRGARPFRVALLTPGPISDQSWNGGAYKGLERIRDSLGASISHIQTKTPAEFDENFRQYGAQGYDLVFGHGFEFQDAAVRVAPEYPHTIYITTSGNRTGPNVAGIEFAFEDASYQAGMIAGAMTKSDVVGVIGGTELPPVKTSFRAFEAGAKAVNPRVRVLTSYVGNWDDVSAAKEQALAQIGQKADVIFQNADQAGLGVFQAAKERRGVYVIGSNSDQNAVAPDVTLGSVVIDLPHAFLSVAREVKDGTFKPRVIELGSATDVVKLVLNPALAATIPATTRAAVDSVGVLLKAGKLSALPK
jgi:basic membrane lipoprotein Med (substrate-binding protein (PBP1-ABC) superfamily)